MKLLLAVMLVCLVAVPAFGQPTVCTIYDIQDGTIAAGTWVEVRGVIATAGAGTFSGSYAFVEESGGGMFSAVEVYWGSAQVLDYAWLTRGDEVNIIGIADEYYGITEINISALGDTMIKVGTATVPGPNLITTFDINNEAWECVLIETYCAQTWNVNPDAPLDFGEWTITDGSGEARVDDKAVTYTRQFGDWHYYTGIVYYGYDDFHLWPRDALDMIATGPSGTEPTTWGNVKALYR
jgi:hypothetical protein